ncbi:MAG: electron transfer flavoprotein subunit beta/FixA family protein, partial [Anaerolineae bacterium]|nr:electron transfer flavoprotein subunit beta/FixA family protein [Anaerolineae bacterium]
MHIVVLTRSVPDTAALPTVDAAGGVTATWDIPEPVINPWDEYAVEEAVLLKEAHGGVVTALAVGPDDDGIALRYAVSMGCDTALRVWDAGLAGADAFGLARAAAAAVRRLGGVDLVLAGKEAVDLNTGAVHLGVARALGWPALTLVDDIVGVDFGAGKITVVRALEQGRQTIRAPLPAVVSVVKAINEPRYPTFAGMRKA